ncbi:MAG: hypothetical protein ACKO38_11630 [Planctomycetota bacterium]
MISLSLDTTKQLADALRWGLPAAEWERLADVATPLRAPLRATRSAKTKPQTESSRDQSGRDPASAAEHWLLNASSPFVSRRTAAEWLAWSMLAGATDSLLPADFRTALVQRLDEWLVPAPHVAVGSAAGAAQSAAPQLDPVTDMWWNVEMPLLRRLVAQTTASTEGAVIAGNLTPQTGVGTGEDMEDFSAAALEGSWPTWMDAEGVPHAAVLDDVWLLLASWTRCWAYRKRLSLEPWSDNLSEQYNLFVQQLCRLIRGDGAALFPERLGSQPSRALLGAALARSPHEETRVTARLAGVLGAVAKSSGAAEHRGKGEAAELPGVTLLPCYAENTGVAVMRSDWTPTALQVAVAFDGHDSRCSISAGRNAWISGEWQARLSINGQTLAPTAPWREVLWFSDDEVDYWEWEQHFGDEWRVQRQVLLDRGSKWCLLADAVLGEQSASIEYLSAWRLAADAAFEPAADSHEGRLNDRQARAVVLPLALPEWRAEATPGTLAANNGQIEFRLRREGQALYAPLFVMADRQLGRQPFTWRRLTVAESLKIVSLDLAAGYRVQFGRKQWTFYRALGAEANRTLLGQNVSSNFLASELQADGLTRPLVRIEASNGGRIGPDAAPRADHC